VTLTERNHITMTQNAHKRTHSVIVITKLLLFQLLSFIKSLPSAH